MELETERLKMVELSFTDAENIHHLHSLPETNEFNTLEIATTIKTTEILLKAWLHLQNTIPRASHIFCINKIDTNEFVGLIALTLGKTNYKIAEVWYKILPNFWNSGFATEALMEILQFGFSKLALHRIEAGCAIENIASIKVLEKVGMLKEGCKRKLLPLKNGWSDNYIYAILETDFYSTNI